MIIKIYFVYIQSCCRIRNKKNIFLIINWNICIEMIVSFWDFLINRKIACGSFRSDFNDEILPTASWKWSQLPSLPILMILYSSVSQHLKWYFSMKTFWYHSGFRLCFSRIFYSTGSVGHMVRWIWCQDFPWCGYSNHSSFVERIRTVLNFKECGRDN